MDDHSGDSRGLSRARLAAVARREARWAVEVMVSQAGGRTITTLASTRSDPFGADIGEQEPVAGLEAADALERAARGLKAELIVTARQAGRTWQEIGLALGFSDGALAIGTSVAQAAYNYAVSWQSPDGCGTELVEWKCLACEQRITDHGPVDGSLAREAGHAIRCYYWAAEMEAWRRSDTG